MICDTEFYYDDLYDKSVMPAMTKYLSMQKITDYDEKVRQFNIIKDNTDTESTCVLGYLYAYDYLNKNEDNTDRALLCFRKATTFGSLEATYVLGCIYYNYMDKERGLIYLQKSAEKGFYKSYEALSRFSDIEGDHESFIKYAILGADAGSVFLSNLIGSYYFYGTDLEQNFELALKYLTYAFKKGDRTQCSLLSKLYGDRRNDWFDPDVAYNYADFGDMAGDLVCTELLGRYYKQGFGCDVELDNAFICNKKLADNNIGSGVLKVGYAYLKGLGVEQDYKKAYEYLMEANIKYKIKESYCALALLFENDDSPYYDPQKAFQYALDGAKLNDNLCAELVSQYYIIGFGCKEDKKKGLEYAGLYDPSEPNNYY